MCHNEDASPAFKNLDGGLFLVVDLGDLASFPTFRGLYGRLQGDVARRIGIHLNRPCGAAEFVIGCPSCGLEQRASRVQPQGQGHICCASGFGRDFDGKGIAQIGHFIGPQLGDFNIGDKRSVPCAHKQVGNFQALGSEFGVGTTVAPPVRHHQHGRDVSVNVTVPKRFKGMSQIGPLSIGLPCLAVQAIQGAQLSVKRKEIDIPFNPVSPPWEIRNESVQGCFARGAVCTQPLRGGGIHQHGQHG